MQPCFKALKYPWLKEEQIPLQSQFNAIDLDWIVCDINTDPLPNAQDKTHDIHICMNVITQGFHYFRTPYGKSDDDSTAKCLRQRASGTFLQETPPYVSFLTIYNNSNEAILRDLLST